MTVLLLDLGNSRWKMARAEGAELGPVISGEYTDIKVLRAAVARVSEQVGDIWLASVADTQTTRSVAAAVAGVCALPMRQVASTDRMPNLVSGYRRPEQLGVDRLLAMVAARARTGRALCVVDAGTAVTIDFVDAQGSHLGGFILPGIRLFRECLLANTAIPRASHVDRQALLGRDTATAVALGARYAVSGIVERFTTGSAALFPGQVVEIFVGGGDAAHFMELLPQPCIKLDHLVLQGLAVMAAGGDG